MQLAATDMELSVRAELLADVHEPGRVVVPGRLLLDIVRHLPAQQVELASGDGPGLLTLECGASRYSLHTYDAGRLPAPRRRSITAAPSASTASRSSRRPSACCAPPRATIRARC